MDSETHMLAQNACKRVCKRGDCTSPVTGTPFRAAVLHRCSLLWDRQDLRVVLTRRWQKKKGGGETWILSSSLRQRSPIVSMIWVSHSYYTIPTNGICQASAATFLTSCAASEPKCNSLYQNILLIHTGAFILVAKSAVFINPWLLPPFSALPWMCVGVSALVCACAPRKYTLDNVTLAYFYPCAVTQCKIQDIPVESPPYRLHKYVSNVIRSQPCVSPQRLT